jgi:cobalt-zinc-cadmium efflux system membrane fusion protein
MVEPAAPHRFALSTHALGTIAFDEDLAIVQAESTLLAAAASDQLTGKELERVRGLAGTEGGIAVKELEQAVSDQQSARSALQAARAALRALGKSDADIDRTLASGRTEIGPDTGKWAVGFVPESDSASLRVGEAVEVAVTVYPERSFHGRVARIYPVLDSDTHRAKFRAQVLDPDDQLHPGMLADVTVELAPLAVAVAVPAAAVVREGDGTTTVWVTTDRHRFVHRSVVVGLQRDGQVQILSGVNPGELVAADGALFLSNLLQSPPTD